MLRKEHWFKYEDTKNIILDPFLLFMLRLGVSYYTHYLSVSSLLGFFSDSSCVSLLFI